MRIRIFCSALLALLMTVAGSMAVHAQAISGQGTWETTLQARDVGNTGTTNAFYDTSLNITWLANAAVKGSVSWSEANNWANNLTVGNVTGWRLSMADSCIGWNCTSSEMGHLWYTELGNTAHSLTNTGNFQNMFVQNYWTAGPELGNPDAGWVFRDYDGLQGIGHAADRQDAMAVHAGDVGSAVTPVPEPETYAMLLAGLGLVGAVARRRRSIDTSGVTPCQL
jgi:hypothetical protein